MSVREKTRRFRDFAALDDATESEEIEEGEDFYVRARDGVRLHHFMYMDSDEEAAPAGEFAP